MPPGQRLATSQPRRYAAATASQSARWGSLGGGYLWRGELRIWDNEVLMGWYAADDGSVRSKGTMHFVLYYPHGIRLTGRRVGLSYDGPIITGWATIARTESDARAPIVTLKEDKRPA